MTELERLLVPRSVAVVGASPTSRHGRAMIENLTSLGFGGEVFAVNPKYQSVAGVPCVATLRDLPCAPDAVMVGVGRERAESVVAEAAGIGAGGAVVTAVGYAETGDAGRDAQERLRGLAEEAGMALIGPNCMGCINFSARTALYLDPVDEYDPGHVSLLSQSGSVAIALINNRRGVRWSHVVSSGNEAVTGSADLLAYAIDDPQTKIVTAFLETIREPERFFAECERAREADKPVVVLKSGRSEASQRAALAHSGALAVSDRLVGELFARHGVIRVETCDDLLNTVILLGAGRLPREDGVAVISESGGEIGLIHDELANRSVRLAVLGEDTAERMGGYLSGDIAGTNPLDLWAMPDAERSFERLLQDLALDSDVGLVLSMLQTGESPAVPGDADGHAVRAAKAAATRTDKPLTLVAPLEGAVSPELVEELAEHGVALMSGVRGAVRAIEHAVKYAYPVRGQQARKALDLERLDGLLRGFGGRAGAGAPALDLLEAAGIPTVRSIEVESEEEAVRAAATTGYPAVVKLGDPRVLHKTDLGGVVLDLRDEDAIRAAVRRIRAISHGGGGRLVVQAQVTDGVELILGMHTEGALGSFVLAGMGGVWAEALNDVAIRPAGLREGEARQMLGELQLRPLLDGFRGMPPVDVAAVVDCIERLDTLAQVLGPRLRSIDVNPLLARPSGVVALDAVVIPAGEDGP